MDMPAGACSTSVLVTHSARCPTTTTTRCDGQLGQRVEDVEHHGPPAQPVQGLGARRAHPGPLAGGEHHRRQRTPTGDRRPQPSRPGRCRSHGIASAAGGTTAIPTRCAARSWAYSSHVGAGDATRRRGAGSHRAPTPIRMPVLTTTIDPTSETYRANRSRPSEAALAEVDEQLAVARAGGGERYVTAPPASGASCSPASGSSCSSTATRAFLELAPLAAWGTEYTVGASLGRRASAWSRGSSASSSANDPTVRGGAMNPFTFRKGARACRHRPRRTACPSINLVESGGADLPAQAELFIPGGRAFRDLTRSSAAALPTIALVFGNSTAGGAYVPGMSDYIVMIEQRSKVFLGGPPLVKMATGEESTDEELGGASMHARVSGLADYLAADELDAIRLGRQIVSRLNWRKLGPGPTDAGRRAASTTPTSCSGIASADPKVPFDPREVLARVVDGSRFDEFKPLYGASLVTGWASIHGYPIGRAGQPPRRALLRGVPQGDPVHPAGQPDRRAAALPPEHDRLHGGQGVRAGAGSSRTAP